MSSTYSSMAVTSYWWMLAASSADNGSSGNENPKAGIIVGAVFGGLVLLVLICMCCSCYESDRSEPRRSSIQLPPAATGSAARDTALAGNQPITKTTPPAHVVIDVRATSSSSSGSGSSFSSSTESASKSPTAGDAGAVAPLARPPDAVLTFSARLGRLFRPSKSNGAPLMEARTYGSKRSAKDQEAADAVLARTIDRCKAGVIFAGRYELTGEHTRGRNSVVCNAVHSTSKAPVAIKMCVDEALHRHEVTTYRALSSRHVARLEEAVAASNGWPAALVLERGEYTLADLLKRSRPEVPRQKAILNQVLQALSSFHQQGVLHNHLRPAHIMWFKDSHSWKLIDLANCLLAGKPLAAPHQYTLRYAAPELIQSEAKGAASVVLHASADMWAFGVVAFEVMTGIFFFGTDTTEDAVYTMLAGRWPLLRRQQKALIGDLEAQRLLDRLLRRSPAARWSAPYAIGSTWLKSAADIAQPKGPA